MNILSYMYMLGPIEIQISEEFDVVQIRLVLVIVSFGS